jgi:hypothetical protein
MYLNSHLLATFLVLTPLGVPPQKIKSAVIMLKHNQTTPFSTSIKELCLDLFAIHLPFFRADIPAIQQEKITENFRHKLLISYGGKYELSVTPTAGD